MDDPYIFDVLTLENVNCLNFSSINLRFIYTKSMLRAPHLPSLRGIKNSGVGLRAERNRCIGCGITRHSTYDCPYGNYPFCYRCKIFGHIRVECRDEWLCNMPGNQPMQNPPIVPQYTQAQNQRLQSTQNLPGSQLLAIEGGLSLDNIHGNFIKISSLSRERM